MDKWYLFFGYLDILSFLPSAEIPHDIINELPGVVESPVENEVHMPECGVLDVEDVEPSIDKESPVP